MRWKRVTESVTKTDGEWANVVIRAEKSSTDFQSHSHTMCIFALL